MSDRTTDTANGERLADTCSGRILWVSDWKCFLVWDGRRWERQPDDTRLEGFAKEMALGVIDEARAEPDDGARSSLLKWADKSLDMGRIRTAVAAVKSVERIRITSDELDQDPYLLNVRNGTVDLRTSELKPHDPEDKLTRLVPHDFKRGAPAPMWSALISRATRVDHTGQTAEFLRMVMGYMLIGGNPEHRMFFVIGPGGTGKSQLVEIPTQLLGSDYAWASKPSLITRGRSDVHTEEVAVLERKRFISISETDGSMRLDESMFKGITGASQMPMRALYGPQRLGTIDATIIVGTNEAPMIAKFDDAVKRRLVIIPSGPPLEASEKDTALKQKILEREAEGVLADLIEGARLWWEASQDQDPASELRSRAVFDTEVPPAVQTATAGFAYEHDPVIQFVDERLDFVEGSRTPAPALMREYKSFASGTEGIGRNSLYDRIVAIAHERGYRFVVKRPREFRGVRILPSTETIFDFEP